MLLQLTKEALIKAAFVLRLQRHPKVTMQEEQGFVTRGLWPGQWITQLSSDVDAERKYLPLPISKICSESDAVITKSVVQKSLIMTSSFKKSPKIQLGSVVDTSAIL